MQEKYSWQFYTSSEGAWEAMLADIAVAKESILLEQFILSTDGIGVRFMTALKEAALRGVGVRILCDEVGSFRLSRSGAASSLLTVGIELKFFNSIVPWNPNNEALWYFRDHRKMLVIDSIIGYTGGVCLGETMRNWRDSAVRIEGPVVSQMIASFDVMWNKTYNRIRYYLHHMDRENPSAFRYVTNAPLPDKHYLYKELIKAIREARHYVYLTTPYLLPDSRLLRALKRAVRKGVEVRLLVPHTTNYVLLDIGMGTFFRDMLEHGIKIYRYPTSVFIHSKTGVVDGSWSTIGSMNLDNLSLRYNFEGNIISTDSRFAFEIEKQFLEDIKISRQLELSAWYSRSMFRKILELIVWPIRKLL